VPDPTLGAHPSLEELEAARPDNGKKPQKCRETREYWRKFLAATERHTEDEIRAVYDMASSTMHQEVNRAKRIVARIEEIEQMETNGESIPQTYDPAPLLLPGQQVHSNTPTPPRRPSLIVVLKVKANLPNNTSKRKRNPRPMPMSPTRAPTTKTTSLLSVRMKTLLTRLRQDLESNPRHPPPLASLTSRFEPAITHLDETALERQNFATCETAATLAGYAAWCEAKGADITRENSAARVSACLVQIIRKWREEVTEAEEAGKGELGETFLQAVMRRLEDLEGVEREVEEEEREYEGWAREVGCG